MTASKKISEAQTILHKMQNTSQDIHLDTNNFVRTIHDMFSHLLDEYNVKFGLEMNHVNLEKFKSYARKTGKIEAINFLIWYEKEYKKLRNNQEFGKLLEKEYVPTKNNADVVRLCSILLDEAKKMAYYAYENF
jgi:2-oxoglutarate dehydrogenase complex dehydrogenase (E1) component-like enzyme